MFFIHYFLLFCNRFYTFNYNDKIFFVIQQKKTLYKNRREIPKKINIQHVIFAIQWKKKDRQEENN
ncbi:hypothetical protein DKP78_02430 [Enterococcus faecium]|nr:hypothetical protein DKP78_02430 [Enterococcus faecium]